MNALLNNTTGEQNTAVGASALATNSTGGFNTAMASNALTSNTNGANNVAIGNSTPYHLQQLRQCQHRGGA